MTKSKNEFHRAIVKHDKERIKSLIVGGYDLSKEDDGSMTALHLALKTRYYDIVEILVENGSDVNTTDSLRETPLYQAIINHAKESILILLEKGADTNVKNIEGDTPLHVAVAQSFVYGIDELAKVGADFTVLDSGNNTLAHIAAVKSQTRPFEVFSRLKEYGTDLNALNNDGLSPLHLAVRKRSAIGVIVALKESGADIDALDKDGNTPAHLAAKGCNHRALEELIDLGANLNIEQDGNTVLAASLEEKNYSIAKFLLKNTNAKLTNSGDPNVYKKVVIDSIKSLGQPGNDDDHAYDVIEILLKDVSLADIIEIKKECIKCISERVDDMLDKAIDSKNVCGVSEEFEGNSLSMLRISAEDRDRTLQKSHSSVLAIRREIERQRNAEGGRD